MEPLILTIDPSQRYLGYAYRTVYNKIVRIGSIEQKTQNNVNWHLRAALMAAEFTRLVEINYSADEMRPIYIVSEVPDNWHTERGQDSKNSEAVQKLYFTSGMILGRLASLPFVQGIWTVLPKQWKGSTSKENMMRRFGKLLKQLGSSVPLDSVDDNAAEAALLGHWCYNKQMLDDDESKVFFEAPYVSVYQQGDSVQGEFGLEVYLEECEDLSSGDNRRTERSENSNEDDSMSGMDTEDA